MADTMSMKVRAFVIGFGAVYVASLTAMFARGWGIAAAYLAMPAWYVVASPFFAVAGWVPGTMDLLGWKMWNTLLLVLSGSLNVFAVYWIARAVERRNVDPRRREPVIPS
jgi:heme/copper-type cytochrome/quinol oxidase subunit 3